MSQNQERLLELAGMYKGLSRRKLALELGRDASNLLPANGNPKLDYLVKLARVLDWPVGEVAEAILSGGDDVEDAGDEESSVEDPFGQLDEEAKTAHREGRYADMVEVSGRLLAAARTPDQRALASLREAGGWDGLGRYMSALDAIRRGLSESIESDDLRRLLQSNLANAHYTLWHLFEARGMARELLDDLERASSGTRLARASQAFAYYVVGHACRRLMGQHPAAATQFAESAHVALQESLQRYETLAAEYDHEPWRGIANTCRGGLIEVELELGQRTTEDALEFITDVVDGNSDRLALGDHLESLGWWCIFGCNITLRHLAGRELQQSMTHLTEKGCEIANRLENWAMRERLFTLELGQRERLNDLAGFPVDWMLGNDQVKTIVGTMGRFPSFRRTGWRILQQATVARTN